MALFDPVKVNVNRLAGRQPEAEMTAGDVIGEALRMQSNIAAVERSQFANRQNDLIEQAQELIRQDPNRMEDPFQSIADANVAVGLGQRALTPLSYSRSRNRDIDKMAINAYEEAARNEQYDRAEEIRKQYGLDDKFPGLLASPKAIREAQLNDPRNKAIVNKGGATYEYNKITNEYKLKIPKAENDTEFMMTHPITGEEVFATKATFQSYKNLGFKVRPQKKAGSASSDVSSIRPGGSEEPAKPSRSQRAQQKPQAIREGTIATNPSNGQRIVFKGGGWVPYNEGR